MVDNQTLEGVYTAKFFQTWKRFQRTLTSKNQIDSLIRDLTWISELVRLNFDRLGRPS